MDAPITILTTREQQVAEMLAWGAAKKQVADRLDISESTVANTARNIYSKLDIHSLGELCAWFFTTKFNISKAYNPLMAVAFMLLSLVNEISISRYKDDVAMRVPRTSRVTKAKGGRRSRREDGCYA